MGALEDLMTAWQLELKDPQVTTTDSKTRPLVKVLAAEVCIEAEGGQSSIFVEIRQAAGKILYGASEDGTSDMPQK